jgi:UDP-N-acetylglucosamine 1-carboxyvinyltransferase
MTHVNFLNQMGASITVDNNTANITGVNKLKGMNLVGSDLRSSAALIIVALTSRNTSYVYGLHHLDRGYESFETKLVKLGARVKREYIVDSRDQVENFATGNSNIDLKVA